MFSAAGVLVALGTAGASAQTTAPAYGAYTTPPSTIGAPAGGAMYGYGTTSMPYPYRYGAAGGAITAPTEGSGTNPYESAVGTSGHAPGR